jgi:hypothetical protein
MNASVFASASGLRLTSGQESSDAPIANINLTSDNNDGRELLSTWCDAATPVLWHRKFERRVSDVLTILCYYYLASLNCGYWVLATNKCGDDESNEDEFKSILLTPYYLTSCYYLSVTTLSLGPHLAAFKWRTVIPPATPIRRRVVPLSTVGRQVVHAAPSAVQ